MPLKKKGKWWHATTAADLDEYLLRYVLGKHCRQGGMPTRYSGWACEFQGHSGEGFGLTACPRPRAVGMAPGAGLGDCAVNPNLWSLLSSYEN
jgi:hypothetical protein